MNSSVNATPRRYWPLGELILARLREFVREPEAVFWTYGFPILMVIALGIAFRNRPVEQIAVDIVDGPDAAAARQALRSSDNPERFEVTIASAEEAGRRLRTGRTDVIVSRKEMPDDVMPEGEGDESAPPAGKRPRPHYVYQFDPTRSESLLARSAVDDQLQRAAGREDVAEVTLVKVEEPGSRYIDFLVPGLVGMSLMGGGLWGVGFVTVDMRVRKLLKRFLATPMKKSDFLLGIMMSRMAFMIPEVAVVLVFARYAFGVVNHGSLLSVMLLIIVGGVMFSGIGLLVASRAKTIEAVSGLMNLTMVPMWIFSGIFFSSERFPEQLQPVIQALPLTPLIGALRAVMLEGARLDSLGMELGIMTAWGAISFLLALRWFRWR